MKLFRVQNVHFSWSACQGRRGSVPGNMLKSHRDYFEGIDRKGCRQDLCFMHRSGSDKTAREIERTTVATNSTRQEASLRPFKDLAVCGS